MQTFKLKDLYKALVTNPQDPTEAINLTDQLMIVPNRWGFMNNLNLFEDKFGTMRAFGFNITTETDAIIKARNWGERNNQSGGQAGKWVQFEIPHYPLDDAIVPTDLQGKIDMTGGAIGQNALKALNKVRMQKIEQIRKDQALTMHKARFQIIKDGTVDADGTLSYDYYDIFGVTRKVVNLDLGNVTQNPKELLGEVFGEIQDSAYSGDEITNLVALCSTDFFNALVTNQHVVESYASFAQPQGSGILNQRMQSGLGLDSRYRVFLYEGIYFVEIRGMLGNAPYVEAGKAYLFPLGTNGVFETHYAPADRFEYVNSIAQEAYLFERMSEDDDFIKLMSQTNFLNIVKRPQLIITLDKN